MKWNIDQSPNAGIKSTHIYVIKPPKNIPPVKLIVFHADANVNNTEKADTRKAKILRIILSFITLILKIIYSIYFFYIKDEYILF